MGSLIGAAFGLIFVLVNTGSVPTGIAVLHSGRRGSGLPRRAGRGTSPQRFHERPAHRPGRGWRFTRGYWLVVAAEVAAIVAGLVVHNTVLCAPQAAVAWISTVVRVHFVALAAFWKLAFFHGLGALLLSGVFGLVLAATGSATRAIDIVGGVLPGAILLGFGLWGATRRAGSRVPPSAP